MKIINDKFSNRILEQEILASAILNNSVIDQAGDIITPNDFFFEENKIIYNYLVDNIRNYSITTLSSYFNLNEKLLQVGGIAYLNEIIQNAQHILTVRELSMQLKNLSTKRAVDTILEENKENLAVGKVDQIINDIQSKLDKISTDDGENITVYNGDDLENDWRLNLQKKEDPIETGLSEVDKMLNGGIYQSELCVLGAAAGCGKTFFSQKIAINAISKNKVCVFVSLEMPKKSLYSRFISILSNINAFRIRIGNIYKNEEIFFNNSVNNFREMSKYLFVTEKSPMTVLDIQAVVKRINKKNKINLLVIDYAQIIRLREDRNLTEASLIKENVHFLANLARKYNIAVLLLSQLTKDKIEGKAGLSAFKGSAGLYEDADIAMTMWDDGNSNNPKTKNLRLDIVKNRNGMTGENNIIFDGSIGQFSINNNIF